MDTAVLTIGLCDDEQVEIDYLAALCKKWSIQQKTSIKIKCFKSAENFLFYYEEDKKVDILLLDIQMISIDGVVLAKQI